MGDKPTPPEEPKNAEFKRFKRFARALSKSISRTWRSMSLLPGTQNLR